MTETGRELLRKLGWTDDGPIPDEELQRQEEAAMTAEAVEYLTSRGYTVAAPTAEFPPVTIKTSDL